MDKDLVSIVIPVYNVEKYIEECIDSALNQDYENIEIIVIDDGSTDESNKICKKFINCKKITLIEQENSGVSVARNKGIDASKGEWIVFVDGDDYMESNMISNLINEVKNNPVDILISPPIFEYENETKYGKIFEKEEDFNSQNKEKIELNVICRQFGNNYNSDIGAGGPWGKLYRRKFLVENKLQFIPGLKRMQDVVFNLYAINAASQIRYKEIYGYHYRINNTSVCVKYNPNIFDIFKNVISEFDKFIKNKPDAYFQAMYLKIILMYIEGARISIMHKDNSCTYLEKIRALKEIYDDETIKNAFKKIKYSNLNMKLKLFVLMCNIKNFFVVYFMISQFMKSKSKEQS